MKILIIKTGNTETFDKYPTNSNVVSLGDVLRTTVILHIFKNDQITWLTSNEALPLLKNITLIKKLVISTEEIKNKVFDIIINLERTNDLLDHLSIFHFNSLIGFSKNSNNETILISNSHSLPLASWLEQSPIDNMNWSEKLFTLFGLKWAGEKYFSPKEVIPTIDSKKDILNIGLNWKVGTKWPSKAWPIDQWKILEDKLSSKFNILWQEGFNDLDLYINWIQSCDLIISHDSLGLHLGIVYNKKVLALFGTSSINEVYLYNLGESISFEHNSIDQIANSIEKLAKKNE